MPPAKLGITNRAESSLSRQVPHILDIGAGIEVGVAATKTFLGQLLAFYGLAMAFAANRGSRSASEIEALADELRMLFQRSCGGSLLCMISGVRRWPIALPPPRT
jgi:glucosamine--fructose-6-phosphate aminotransferase (isomerizing)